MTNSQTKESKMGKHIDEYSYLQGYISAYTYFKDVLTDRHYEPIEQSVDDVKSILERIETDRKKLEERQEQL
jgi:hypothetical protein